ncbi:MAG: NAD(P)H-quinone oxidoreductase [Gemmatimonadota bacterium]
MRAIVISKAGPPGVLQLRDDVAAPVPAPHEIRVRVHAAAVNRADLLQREGRYPAPAGVPQDIPGLEYAGTVDRVGEAADRWRQGDRVMGIIGGGGYAELVVTHQDEALHIPDGMGFSEAAAVPEAFITAHDALITRMRLIAGEALLIHAVGSGVGTAALQLAHRIGARVLGTQRSRWKLDRAAALGLDVAIDARGISFAAEVRAATGGKGVDGVLDLVGGDYMNENVRALAQQGRILLVGLVAGTRTELDMRAVLTKRATIIGTVLRARPLEEKVEAARAFERDVLPLLESGAVVPVVAEVLPLAQASRAHELLAGNATFGKVVLSVA